MAEIIIKAGQRNILDFGCMEDWENGTSSAPTEHTLSGSGASVSRETTIVKVGSYSAAVTRSGADTTLYHDVSTYADYVNRKVTFGCWVNASVADRARIAVSDGVGSTNSSYHSGIAGWEYLTVTHDIDASATRLRVEMQINTGNTTAYFDGAALNLGDLSVVELSDYMCLSGRKASNRYTSQSYEIPRTQGKVIPNFHISSKSLSYEIQVIGSTPTAKRTNVDTIMKIMNSYILKPDGDIDYKDFYFFDDRVLRGIVTGIELDDKAAGRVSDGSIKIELPDPFYYSTQKYRTTQALSGTTAFTVTNNGSATTLPFIRLTNGSGGNITSLSVHNLTTDQKVAYSGTLANGDDLTIDAVNLDVQNDGVSDLGNVTNEIAIDIVPGDNEFSIAGFSTGTAKIDFFNRWY
jgi:phage-related protein